MALWCASLICDEHEVLLQTSFYSSAIQLAFNALPPFHLHLTHVQNLFFFYQKKKKKGSASCSLWLNWPDASGAVWTLSRADKCSRPSENTVKLKGMPIAVTELDVCGTVGRPCASVCLITHAYRYTPGWELVEHRGTGVYMHTGSRLPTRRSRLDYKKDGLIMSLRSYN